MTQAIPASQIISSDPSVLSPGSNSLSPNGVILTRDTSIPIGTAQAFTSATDMDDWFGAQSNTAILGGVYFTGYENADTLPSTLYAYQVNPSAVAAYVRSASLSSVALTTLQSYSGTLTLEVDGRSITSNNINLSSATSFSNAAQLIQTGLQQTGNVFVGTVTTTTGGTATTITIDSVTSGALHIGDVVVATGIPTDATITAFGTGTGGTGTYTISAAATAAESAEAITVTIDPTVSYDAQRAAFVITSPSTGVNSSITYPSGAFATDLKLTSATGAVISSGADAAVPATAMNTLIGQTLNWVTFFSDWEMEVSEAEAYAAWANGSTSAGTQRFLFIEWDSNGAEAASDAASGSFGAIAVAAAYNGSCPIYDLSTGQKAAFLSGSIACINTDSTAGSLDPAFQAGSGLSADVVDGTTATNLRANGYNYYGKYGTNAQVNSFFYPASLPGEWKWVQPYVNQILMNADFQSAYMTYRTSVKRVPFNAAGTTSLRSVFQGVIDKYLTFGAIQKGITLSNSQIQSINTAAGNTSAASEVANNGYYMQLNLSTVSPSTRSAGGPVPAKIWYTDGGSVHTISVASIDVQ